MDVHDFTIPADVIEQLWSKVDQSGGPDACWPWTGRVDRCGYGQLWAVGRRWQAHRLAYQVNTGAAPGAMCVCHSCDSPPCCNPAHLWIGTHADNVVDRSRKGRSASGDASGVRLHPDRFPRGDAHYARLQPERLARGERHGLRLHPERIARGERIAKARLTEADVRRIRVRSGRGESSRSIAGDFGVHPSTIMRVVAMKTWRHVEGDEA